MTEKLKTKDKMIIAVVISLFALVVGFAIYFAINHPYLINFVIF